MAKFRKKPVVVEAWQFGTVMPMPAWVEDAIKVGVIRSVALMVMPPRGALDIHTLEGVMRADEGDWIIRGVNGELYPCKPDVFEKSYAPAD